MMIGAVGHINRQSQLGDWPDGLSLVKDFACVAGYVRNIPVGVEFRGENIALVARGMADSFSDIHREIFDIYSMGDTVGVELAIRGTHDGALVTPQGNIPATGKSIDVACCDVFHMKEGKVVSFHCYNAASVAMQQLDLAGNFEAA